MPINYLSLQPQIAHMAEQTRAHKAELETRLSRCLELLESSARDLIPLQRKVEEAAAKEKNLRCAVPISEPLNTHIPAKEDIPTCTILAADGSQITPNPHESVFYGLVNVGVFRISLGRGETPGTQTWSDLIYEENDAENREILSEELIALRRDVFEREILAGLAKKELAPLITLTDGPLELYHEPRADRSFDHYFRKYLAALDELALLNTISAGYVDRPRAALLVNLLELAAPASVNNENAPHPFAGVSDLALMARLLQPGERSAVFALRSRSSAEFEGRKALHFFYLNVGGADHPSIARVEIPAWVLESDSSLEMLHAVLLTQARQAGAHPYPYALIRAHETAVVKLDEHEYLDTLIQNELLSRGQPLALNSEKLINKMIGNRTRL